LFVGKVLEKNFLAGGAVGGGKFLRIAKEGKILTLNIDKN